MWSSLEYTLGYVQEQLHTSRSAMRAGHITSRGVLIMCMEEMTRSMELLGMGRDPQCSMCDLGHRSSRQ